MSDAMVTSVPVLTVTLNPALDQTIILDQLRVGEVNRAVAAVVHAGGKGVNVISCLADWESAGLTATGILGADNQAPFAALFQTKSIIDGFIRVSGETRTNIKLSHEGETTDINLPGLTLRPDAIDALFEAVRTLTVPGGLVLLAGSLPAGLTPALYPRLAAQIAGQGARVLVDSSGAPLRAALDGPALPSVIKPNREELEEFVGHRLADDAALLQAARELTARGVSLVVVSLGAEGALFITASAAMRAALPPLRVTSTVGAGDAMMAGIITGLREGAGLERIARLGTAFAVGKLAHPGANLPPRQDVEALAGQVQIIINQ